MLFAVDDGRQPCDNNAKFEEPIPYKFCNLHMQNAQRACPFFEINESLARRKVGDFVHYLYFQGHDVMSWTICRLVEIIIKPPKQKKASRIYRDIYIYGGEANDSWADPA